MISRTTNVATVGGSLPLNPQWRMIERGDQRHHWPIVAWEVVPSRHCPCFADFRIVVTTIRQSEILAGGADGASAPKAERPPEGADGWAMVVCRPQRGKAVGVACPRCTNPWNCGRSHRRPQCNIGSSLVAVDASHLSPMCCIWSVIFGQLMSWFYPASGIAQSAKKLEKRAILSGSIVPFDNECLDWSEKHCHFPKT